MAETIVINGIEPTATITVTGDGSTQQITAVGSTGLQGPQGATGATGATGPGVATGGTAGQYLKKNSGTNYDTTWADFNAAVQLNRLDQLTIPQADVSWNGNRISDLDDPTSPQDAATKYYVDNFGGGGGGGGSTSSFSVAQTAHGFAVGDVVRNSGVANTYTKAQADSAAHAEVVGIVSHVTSANLFTLTTQGVVEEGVPAATAGSVLFLDPSTAGALTSTEPSTTGDISKPLVIVLESSVKMVLFNFRGEVVAPAGSGGGGSGTITVEELDGSPTITDVTGLVVTNGTLTDNGDGTVTLDTGGSGDVSASSNFANDNRLIRSDGTSKVVQASPITVDDSGNTSGVGTFSSP